MKRSFRSLIYICAVGAVTGLVALGPGLPHARAQWPFATPTTPDAQRNALSTVQSRVNWLQNSTRTAGNFPSGGYDMLWQQFSTLRASFNAFKSTLTPQQLNYGANDLAELDAGLDIIQEGFAAYQDDVANGRPPATALRSLCDVLGQASGYWWQELKRDSARLRVGML